MPFSKQKLKKYKTLMKIRSDCGLHNVSMLAKPSIPKQTVVYKLFKKSKLPILVFGYQFSPKYIRLFSSMDVKSLTPQGFSASHHCQGMSLPARLKTRIDFKKTCSMDLFCSGVTKRSCKKGSEKKRAYVFPKGMTQASFCGIM